MGVKEFEGSSGWRLRFRERRGISWNAVSGDEKSADINAAKMWKEEKLLEITRSYKAEDFFNTDGTARYYKLLPGRTTAYKEESAMVVEIRKKDFRFYFLVTHQGQRRCGPWS
jgi:hypothetical protein